MKLIGSEGCDRDAPDKYFKTKPKLRSKMFRGGPQLKRLSWISAGGNTMREALRNAETKRHYRKRYQIVMLLYCIRSLTCQNSLKVKRFKRPNIT